MKNLFLLSIILLGGSVPSFSQSIVEMKVAQEQNPLFEVFANDVNLSINDSSPEAELGAGIVIKGGSGSYSFRWYTEDENELGSDETLTITSPGIYLVDISDTCDCLQTIRFNVSPASVNDIDQDNITVYPNPTQGLIHIKGSETIQVTGVDMAGRLVLLIDREGEIIEEADLSSLPSGIYFITLTDVYGKKNTFRIIKK